MRKGDYVKCRFPLGEEWHFHAYGQVESMKGVNVRVRWSNGMHTTPRLTPREELTRITAAEYRSKAPRASLYAPCRVIDMAEFQA